MRTVNLINTGGTIEKAYQETDGSLLNLDARLDSFLRRIRLPDVRLRTTRLMNVDSLQMGQEDRDLVAHTVAVKQREGYPIVVTHGTDTMVETGKAIKAALADPTVAVIMTGAMVPLGFENSDGLQNLAEAIFATLFLPPGVWVVMHGQVFPVDNARKNRERGTFEVLDPQLPSTPLCR
ncbi:asparaginase [Candidatus Fermentibacteria bacterium]|nr:asparaginase [Candidatus Fermentibacteria bacterium]